MKEKIESIIGISALGLALLLITFLAGVFTESHKLKNNPVFVEKIIEEEGKLSDWEVLELAIMKTESDMNTYARGTKGDLGLFQITEIYVEEVNRLLGEPTYVHTDAFIPERALEMFDIYQQNHNPGRDFIRAINAHNPGGESIGYSQKVLSNMEWIRNYENYRQMVREFTPKE